MLDGSNSKKEQILKILKQSKSIVLTSHKRPDHDAILSCILMFNLIKKYLKVGANVEIAFESNIELKESDFPEIQLMKSVEDLSLYIKGFDTVIFLDGDTLNRFSKSLTEKDLDSLNVIRIDHHAFELNIFQNDISTRNVVSTTQLLYEYFLKDFNLSPEDYEYVLIGILADSGFFRYVLPTNFEVLSTVSDILKKNYIDLGNVYAKLNIFSQSNFLAVTELMNNTKFSKLNGNVAKFSYSFIDNRDLDDTAGIYQTNILRLTEGFPWGFTVYWIDDQNIKVSFRALHEPNCPNVRELARKLFNGGGHVGASGASLSISEIGITKNESLETACDYIINQMNNNLDILEKITQAYEPI